MFCVVTLPDISILADTSPATRRSSPREENGKHPDGTIAYTVRLGIDGNRAGDYTSYFPGGKKLVQERSHYEAGELTGPRTLYDEKGHVVGDETWFKGQLIFRRSAKVIESKREQIKHEVADYLRKNPPTIPAGGPSLAAMGEALVKIRTYRYLCGVADDVIFDDDYIDLCQHAAIVMEKLNKLTHTPEKPDGVSDDFYEKAKQGCRSSNIFSENSVSLSVDAFMDDSNSGNIDRLGHRRWILNPLMSKTGFGAGAARFSAMYSFDRTRSDVPDYQFVSFPPRGYLPASMFRPGYAWHISVNPEHYSVDPDAKMTIYAVDNQYKRAKEPLELNYEHVNMDGFGIANAIIARPKVLTVKPGAVYQVVITGVNSTTGAPAEISYYVSFY